MRCGQSHTSHLPTFALVYRQTLWERSHHEMAVLDGRAGACQKRGWMATAVGMIAGKHSNVLQDFSYPKLNFWNTNRILFFAFVFKYLKTEIYSI